MIWKKCNYYYFSLISFWTAVFYLSLYFAYNLYKYFKINDGDKIYTNFVYKPYIYKLHYSHCTNCWTLGLGPSPLCKYHWSNNTHIKEKRKNVDRWSPKLLPVVLIKTQNRNLSFHYVFSSQPVKPIALFAPIVFLHNKSCYIVTTMPIVKMNSRQIVLFFIVHADVDPNHGT